jgi:ferric-dicitrate binding protein FerR (iron transport regulator)
MNARDCARYSDQIFAGQLGPEGARHLSECPACHSEFELAKRVKALLGESDELTPTGARRHRRLINTALLQAAAPTSTARGVRRFGWPTALAAAAGVALLAGLGTLLPDAVQKQSRAVHAPAKALPSETAYELAPGAQQKLGSITVSAEQPARFSWDERASRLTLNSGAVVVDLPPGAVPGFHVLCPSFRVEVTGTRFRVDQSSVRVERGGVRVRSRSTQQLLAELEVGKTWTIVPAAAALEVSSAFAQADVPEAPPDVQAAPGARKVRPAPAELLRSARNRIAHKDVAGARSLLGALRTSELTPEQRLEADSLRAEADLVEGKSRAAVDGYSAAARSPAAQAEVAEFAAARLEAERGDPSRAQHLLQQYLERHPDGSFRREARARLRQLGGAP